MHNIRLYSINSGNYKTLCNLIDQLYMQYSKVLVLRIDLSFTKEYSPDITHHYARERFNQLRNNMRFNRLFDHLITYAAKLEYGQEKGWHYHTLFFFDGQRVQKDIWLAQQIGKYWTTVINRDAGLHHSCNLHKDEYEFCALGNIAYNETVKINDLKNYVAPYLCKIDPYLESLQLTDAGGKSLRTFNVGRIEPNDSQAGRPRKYAI